MLRVALKGLMGHKLRFLLTALAVVLGVTFVVGSFVLTDSIEDGFGALLDTAYEDQDLIVRPISNLGDFTTEQPGTGPTLDAAVLDDVAGVDGVADAAGGVAGTALFVGRDGEPLGGNGPPALAFSWSEVGNPLRLRDGAAPAGPDEVTMDAGTAERADFAVGDEVEVVLPTDVRTFTIAGITGFGESDNLMGASIATFDLDTAQTLFDKEGSFDEIAVAAADDVDVEVLRDRVASAVGSTGEVVTTEAQVASDQADIGEALGFINTALLAFAGVALFVGAFIVVNTFSIVVAQRSREFALLRAVGASASQVRTAVLVEATAVGLVASGLGLAFGIGAAFGLRAAMGAFGIDIPTGGLVVATRTVVVAVVVGSGVTLVSSLTAARRASKVAPIEAMRGTRQAAQGLGRRTVAGGVALAVGVVLLLVGLLVDVEVNRLALVGGGALVTLLAVSLLAPLAAVPIATVVGALPGRLGVAGRLAQRNARSERRRTASTASALMIGLALVTFVTILAASIQGAVADTLDDQFRADFVLQAGAFGAQGIPDSLVTDLDTEPTVGAVSGIGYVPWVDDGDQRWAAGVDAATISDVVALDADGDVAALADDGVLVQQDALADRGLAVGDTLPMTFAAGSEVPFEIVGTFANAELVGATYVLDADVVEAHATGFPTGILYATAADDIPAAREAIDTIIGDYPGVEVQDQAEFRASQEQSVDQVLGLMMALLALAIIIALLGITNTLALTVFERTREIGLLRAVGMTRRQTRSMVTWEAVIVAVFGALLGLGVGTFFGWAVVRSLAEEGIERMVLPGGQLVVYLIAAGVAGVIAALFPAWRASRLDVLEAVTTE